MDSRVYWIWLQQGLKYASNKIRAINLIYENAEDFYNAGPLNWRMCGCFIQKEIDFIKSCSLDKAACVLDKCLELGYKVITMEDEEYPERLKNISNPPCVLYVKGKMPPIDSKICISIVGTRSATLYGVQMSFDISLELAKAGTVIVSGGALGVDSSAHKGAIQGRGQTVAVLGCGINYPYLMQNAPLRDVISRNGAIISEFAPDYPAYHYNFPMRNRIISGLSQGTVVIEAGKKSGSLITASLALEQNRDVFAVPVDMNSSVSEGTTALIRDGATVVTCGEDVLSTYRHSYFRDKNFEDSELPEIFPRPTQDDYEKENAEIDTGYNKGTISRSTKASANKKEIDKPKSDAIKLSFDEQTVYNVLKKGKQHIDVIAAKTGFPISKVLSIITVLEISGVVKAYAGKIYGI